MTETKTKPRRLSMTAQVRREFAAENLQTVQAEIAALAADVETWTQADMFRLCHRLRAAADACLVAGHTS
jgi:hypothetical protein